jgi:hypothetical protein
MILAALVRQGNGGFTATTAASHQLREEGATGCATKKPFAIHGGYVRKYNQLRELELP